MPEEQKKEVKGTNVCFICRHFPPVKIPNIKKCSICADAALYLVVSDNTMDYYEIEGVHCLIYKCKSKSYCRDCFQECGGNPDEFTKWVGI